MSIFTGIKNFAAKTVTKTKLGLKANYPTIMVVGGTAMVIGAGVIGCVQTAKHMNDILDKHNERMEKCRELKEAIENGEDVELEEGKTATLDDIKKHKTAVVIGTVKEMTKTYAPAVALAILGVFLILAGNRANTKRYVAAAAEAYAATEAFHAYRDRVKDRFGKEVEEEIFTNGARHLMKEEEIDPETGEKKETTKEVLYGGECGSTKNLYQYIFDEANCPHTWSRHPGYNYNFLINTQNNANEYLKSHGSITLADVLKQLGYTDFEPECYKIGWMLNNPTGYGDNYVDFGICNTNGNYNDAGCFTGGLPDYMLNFNCDGDIVAAMMIAREQKKAKKAAEKAIKKGKIIAKAVVKQ